MSATTGRRRVYGVDFSGAQDAGRHVWLASATRREAGLVVEGCFPASALPGSGTAREDCLPALRRFLAGADDAVVGIDVPFGLPAELLDADSWSAFAQSFPVPVSAGTDGDSVGPSDWAAACRERAEGLDRERVELLRRTEAETGAPFSPYNLRMRSATFHGIRSVLAPLVAEEAVAVLPMQPPNPGQPWLVEACPAVTLDRLGLDGDGYKDDTAAARERRSAILDVLADGTAASAEESAENGASPQESVGNGAPVTVVPSVREAALADADGDALDAVLAAVGVTRALDRGEPVSPGTVDARTRLEGKIYA